MKKLFIYTILISIFTVSCQTPVENESENILVEESNVTFYKGDYMSDIVESFDIIPLETNDSSLIGMPHVIKKRNHRYFLKFQDKLSVFDEQGKFIMNVGNIGQGPGEYPMISNFDADNENIYILSNKGKILFYNINNGAFEKEINIAYDNFTYGFIKSIDNGFLLASAFVTENRDGLIYIDMEGNVKATAMPLHLGNTPKGNIHWLKWKEDCFIYHLSVSNDLYCFNATTKEFTTLTVSNEDGLLTAQDVLELGGYNNGKMMDKRIFDMADSKKQFVWGRLKSDNMYYDIYNKETRKVFRFDVFKTQDDLFFSTNENEMLHLMYLPKCSSDDDYFISITDANMLKEKAEERDLLSTPPYSKLKDIPEDANPAIIRLKFK